MNIKKTDIVDPMYKAILNIEKNLSNKESPLIVRYGDKKYEKTPSISYGIQEVDNASGCGGLPRGKLIELFGPESGGKSFLALKLIASAQKQNLKCCLVDLEQSFQPEWAEKNGVDCENLYILEPDLSAEKILDYVNEICKSKKFGLVVIDSTAALATKKELEGSVENQDYAPLARVLSKGLKKIKIACGSSLTSVIFINQLREKVGILWGSNETTPGGRALKFYADQRVKVSPVKTISTKINEEDVIIGRVSKVKFEKNKIAPPFGTCEFQIMFDETYNSPVFKLVNLARNQKLISIRAGIYSLSKELMGTSKNVSTECSSLEDVADYIVINNLTNVILDKLIEMSKEENFIIEKDILDIKNDKENNIDDELREDADIELDDNLDDNLDDELDNELDDSK